MRYSMSDELSGDLTWLTAMPIAHRGLHDLTEKRPENSMAAFEAAIGGSYAIECDLQPSADNVAMVFHDYELERMTGQSGNTRDMPAADLARLTLAGTGETIPALSDLLSQTSGAVPLILELKSQRGHDNSGFASTVIDALKGYAGAVAVMSFDPELVGHLAGSAPDLPRGLVAEGQGISGLGMLKTVFRQKLDFVSYSIDHLPTPAPFIVRTCLRKPLICWTVRTDAQRRRAARWADQITFEGFTP